MNYFEGEALILERIRSTSSFGVENSSQANWAILSTGKSDHYAILKGAEWNLNDLTLASFMIEYQTIIEIWQRYTTTEKTRTEIYRHIYELLDLLAYPKLGSASILHGRIMRANELEQMSTTKIAGIDYLRQNVFVVWKVEKLVTYQE